MHLCLPLGFTHLLLLFDSFSTTKVKGLLQTQEIQNSSSYQLFNSDKTPARSPKVQAFSLNKRDDEAEDDLSVRHIEILTSTVPIATAASALEFFYNSILYNALAPWSDIEPQLALSVTLGSLQLSISVTFNYGNVPRGIPWAFVRNFARNMIRMTRRGFTGTYNMLFTTVGRDGIPPFGVEVRLRVVWDTTGMFPALPGDAAQVWP